MDDVRAQLYGVLYDGATDTTEARWQLVDAILERFDVTPKPVITARELGGMVYRSIADAEGDTLETQWTEAGMHMLRELTACGLRIVRVDE